MKNYKWLKNDVPCCTLPNHHSTASPIKPNRSSHTGTPTPVHDPILSYHCSRCGVTSCQVMTSWPSPWIPSKPSFLDSQHRRHSHHVLYQSFELYISGSKKIKRLRSRKYDQVMIERDIGLLLAPSRALSKASCVITVVTPTDRPKSVRNRWVIEVLVAFLCFPLVFEFSVGIGFFCHRTESDLLFLFMLISRLAHIQWHPPTVRLFNQTMNFYAKVSNYRAFATGVVCCQGTLTPLDTWSCPIFGLACNFPAFAVR